MDLGGSEQERQDGDELSAALSRVEHILTQSIHSDHLVPGLVQLFRDEIGRDIRVYVRVGRLSRQTCVSSPFHQS